MARFWTFEQGMSDHHLHMAELFLRIFVGVLFLFQGYDKLFRIKISGVVEAFRSEAAIYQIPRWLLSLLAYYTSLTEFIGGAFLLAGLFSEFTIVLLLVDLILVSIAFSFIEPMWDTKHVFPRFIALIALLLLHSGNNPYSLDQLFIN